MCHVPRQHDLFALIPERLEVGVEIGGGEGAGVLFGDGVFAGLGGEFVELGGQRGVGREHGGAVGRLVHDVDDLLWIGVGAVLVEEGGDVGARLFDALGF